MNLAARLNGAGVVVAFGSQPVKTGTLVTAEFADERAPFLSAEALAVFAGPDFSARALAAIAERSRNVCEAHGIVEVYVHVSTIGQLQVRVFTDSRAESAMWIPFPTGASAGSWM